MSSWLPIITLIIGSCTGCILAWVHFRGTLAKERAEAETKRAGLQAALQYSAESLKKTESQLEEKQQQEAADRASIAQLESELTESRVRRQEEQRAAQEKIDLLQKAEEQLSQAFKALSADALKSNNQAFIDLAKATLERFQSGAKDDLDKRRLAIQQLMEPISASLKKVDDTIETIEKDRTQSFSSLTEQIKHLSHSHNTLQKETTNLVNALQKPSVRGSWGELQLRRAVEFAGMVECCDFIEQESTDANEGRLRPDMIVNLPNGRRVIVDAKTPMESYLKAVETKDPQKSKTHLKQHARQLRDKIRSLSLKKYWQQFEPTPEFVVLFLPNEALFSAALEYDAELIDFGAQSRVILTTPTTLIALLLAVAHGWQQETMAENAKQVSELGRELYDRIGSFALHFAGVGKHLRKTVDDYNKAIGSIESRVLVTARKFKAMGSGTDKGIAH